MTLLLTLTLLAVPQAQPDPAFASYTAHIAAAEYALRLDEGASARRWLEQAPKAERGFEWHYLHSLADQSIATLGGFPDAVRGVDVDRNGKRLAAACMDGKVRIYDLATRELQQTLEGHKAGVYVARFSPDGAQIATASADRTAKVFEVATGKELVTFTGHKNPVAAVAWSPDGLRLASCSYDMPGGPDTIEGGVRFWDPASGTEEFRLGGGRKPLTGLAWSKDGQRLAASSWDFAAFVWKVAPGEAPAACAFPDEDVYRGVDCVAFSPDAALLAAGAQDGKVRVFDSATTEQKAVLAHAQMVHALAFSPDGAWLATGSRDGSVRIFATKDWRLLAQLRGHDLAVRALAFTPDGKQLLSGAVDKTVRFWDVTQLDHGTAMRRHAQSCYFTPWSADSALLASCGYDGSVALWDAATLTKVAHWKPHPPGEQGSCHVTGFSRDGRFLITCSYDKTVKVFDLVAATLHATLEHASGLYAAAIAPDARFVVAAERNQKRISLWDLQTRQRLAELPTTSGTAQLAFTPDSAHFASCHGNGTVRLWSAHDGKLVHEWKVHTAAIDTLAIAADGRRLVTGSSDGTVRVIDLVNQEIRALPDRLAIGVYRIDWSPDGKRIAAGGTGGVTLLDAERLLPVVTLRPHKDTIWHLAFSPDGTRLATASWDGTIAWLDTRPFAVRTAAAAAADPKRFAHLTKAFGIDETAVPVTGTSGRGTR